MCWMSDKRPTKSRTVEHIYVNKCHSELFCVEHMSEMIDEVELVELNVEHILAKSTCE